MIYRCEYAHNNLGSQPSDCSIYVCSNYCTHIRICKSYIDDLTSLRYIGDNTMA